MTIMIAEAAPEAAAAAETTAADAGTLVTRPRHARPRALPRAAAANREARPPSRTRPAASRQPAPPPSRTGRRAQSYAAGLPSFRGRGSSSGSTHNAIKAEFLAAIVIIVLAPFFTPGPSSAKGGSGPSPYGRQDLVRLGAVFAVFFILSLLSKGRPGKMAAMFGALIVLGVLFQASKSGAVSGMAKVFTKGSAASSASTATASTGTQAL